MCDSNVFLKQFFFLKPLFQDSPTNKLLYAKEIPEYKKRVQLYYQQIQEMAPLSEQEMNAHLAEESRVSQGHNTTQCANLNSASEGGLIEADFHSTEVQKRIQHQPGLDGDLQICQKIQEPGERRACCCIRYSVDAFWSHRKQSLQRWLWSLAQIAIGVGHTVSVRTIMCMLNCSIL